MKTVALLMPVVILACAGSLVAESLELDLKSTAVGMEVHFEGVPGQTYDVLASTDLREWGSLGPATEVAEGAFILTDTRPRTGNGCFYRVSSNVLGSMTPPSITGNPCDDLDWDIRSLQDLLKDFGCDEKEAELAAAREALAAAQAAKTQAQEALDAFMDAFEDEYQSILGALGDAQRASDRAAQEMEERKQALIDAAAAQDLKLNDPGEEQSITLIPGIRAGVDDPPPGWTDTLEAWHKLNRDTWMEALRSRGQALEEALDAYTEAANAREEAEESFADIEQRRAELSAQRSSLLNALDRACRELDEAQALVNVCEAELRDCQESYAALVSLLEEKEEELERCRKVQPLNEERNRLHERLNELYRAIREIEEGVQDGGDEDLTPETEGPGEASKLRDVGHAREVAREARDKAIEAFDRALELEGEAVQLLLEGDAEGAREKFREAEAKRAEAEREVARAHRFWAQAAACLLEAERIRQEILDGLERMRELELERWVNGITPAPTLDEPRQIDDPDQLKFGAQTVLARAHASGLKDRSDCEKKALQASRFTNSVASDFFIRLFLDMMAAPLQIASGGKNVLQLGVSLGRSLLGAVTAGESFSERAARDVFSLAGGVLFPKLVGDELGGAINDLAQGGIDAIAAAENIQTISWSGNYEGCNVTTTLMANPNTGWAVMFIKVEGCPLVAVRYKFRDGGAVGDDARIHVSTITN